MKKVIWFWLKSFHKLFRYDLHIVIKRNPEDFCVPIFRSVVPSANLLLQCSFTRTAFTHNLVRGDNSSYLCLFFFGRHHRQLHRSENISAPANLTMSLTEFRPMSWEPTTVEYAGWGGAACRRPRLQQANEMALRPFQRSQRETFATMLFSDKHADKQLYDLSRTFQISFICYRSMSIHDQPSL